MSGSAGDPPQFSISIFPYQHSVWHQTFQQGESGAHTFFRRDPVAAKKTREGEGAQAPFGPARQMSCAYSSIDRSEENQAIRAVLRTAIASHLARSFQTMSSWRCVSQ